MSNSTVCQSHTPAVLQQRQLTSNSGVASCSWTPRMCVICLEQNNSTEIADPTCVCVCGWLQTLSVAYTTALHNMPGLKG